MLISLNYLKLFPKSSCHKQRAKELKKKKEEEKEEEACVI